MGLGLDMESVAIVSGRYSGNEVSADLSLVLGSEGALDKWHAGDEDATTAWPMVRNPMPVLKKCISSEFCLALRVKSEKTVIFALESCR